MPPTSIRLTLAVIATSIFTTSCSSIPDTDDQKITITREIQDKHHQTVQILDKLAKQRIRGGVGHILATTQEKLKYSTSTDYVEFFSSSTSGQNVFSVSAFYYGGGSVSGFTASNAPLGYVCVKYTVDTESTRVSANETLCPHKLLSRFSGFDFFQVHV